MKIKVPLVVLLLCLAYGSARADGGGCEAPPYGASLEAYRAFVLEPAQSDAGTSPEARKVSGEVLAALVKVCKMKYEAADRTELYRAGFTPQDIERSSTMVLAAEYLAVRRYVAFQSQVHGQPDVKPGAPMPPPDDYLPVRVPDFASEGAKLAGANAKVSLTGSYILQGDRGVLYENIQAVIKAKAHPDAEPQPNVPLLTDAASPRVRRRLLGCQTDPSAAQVGCTVTLRGQVTMCRSSNVPEAASEGPCLKVDDGK